MKRTVLLIEDNPQNRYLVTYLLEQNGFAVVTANDGKQALERIVAGRPDIILLDIQLPERDGYAVASDLRALPELLSTPIIALTSYAMMGDRERAIAAGCDGYMEKPIDPEAFINDISAFLPPAPDAEDAR